MRRRTTLYAQSQPGTWLALAALLAAGSAAAAPAGAKKPAVKPQAQPAAPAPSPAATQATPAPAQAPAAPLPSAPLSAPAASRPLGLADVGMQLERARTRGVAERDAALADVEQALAQVMRAGLSASQRNAAQFISAELLSAHNDFQRAESAYRDAEKSDKTGPFADDAGLAAIAAQEARGQDAAAAKAWIEWEKRYPASPLRAEVKLARTWNALRRLALPEAGTTLAELKRAFPWMEQDARVQLATGTLAYLEGRAQDGLAALGDKVQGPAAIYLRALCNAATGARLRAAALFQELADRYPTSPLRDHALLAKANSFLDSKAYRSAAEEFARIVPLVSDPNVRAECELRQAAAFVLEADFEHATPQLRQVVANHAGTDVAARAQFLLGEALYTQKQYDGAILEYNRVLTSYFEHSIAALAQYRIGRSLDALDRRSEATGSYQAVVKGYPLEPEAPAAAYLAGLGMLEQGKPLAAAPYFQLVLDRYARRADDTKMLVFESPEHQELVEAALCLLFHSYHKAGDLGQLSGAPHLTLQQMPPSKSPWRAYALLIDADALAAQGRLGDAQATLEGLIRDFPDRDVAVLSNRLLAWTYAQQGQDELAISTEERMLARYAGSSNPDYLATAFLNKAHVLFNHKSYVEAAAAYEEYLRRFPEHSGRLMALYQAGLAYSRLERNGDAVDRWEAVVAASPKSEIAERAWARAGDLYFRAEHYDDAKRAYQGLLQNFADSQAASLALLRLAQCDYNAGRDAEALRGFSELAQRFPESGLAKEAVRGQELALYRLGQQKGGVETLAQLVEQYPTSSFAADAQFRIATSHYEAKRYAEAADAFRRVVTQFPGYSAADKAHYLMADALEQAENVDEARRGYEQFLMFFPQSELRSTAQFRLAMLDFNAGDYMRAAVQFTGVLDTQTSAEMTTASLYNLALCQRMLGDVDAARVSLERYRKEYPNDARAADLAYQMGDLHDKAGQTDQAAAEFESALGSHPAPALATELHFRLGACHEKLGDAKAALADYRRAMLAQERSDAFRLSAVARIAALCEEKANTKGALEAYRDLIRNAKDPELVAAAKERVAQLRGTVQDREDTAP